MIREALEEAALLLSEINQGCESYDVGDRIEKLVAHINALIANYKPPVDLPLPDEPEIKPIPNDRPRPEPIITDVKLAISFTNADGEMTVVYATRNEAESLADSIIKHLENS